MTRSPSAAPLRAALLGAAASIAALPLAAPAHEPGAVPEIVAEALFLCDHLPPGGRDVNLSLAVHEGEPDAVTGERGTAISPRVQLAMAITERVGFTLDTGFATGGEVIDTPGASLKLLLRQPVPGRTGLAASLDLYGSVRSLGETEAGLGLGAIRSFGRLALRAGASVASGVSSWGPHLHAGASAALALGARWRVLAEVVTDVSRSEALLSAGPTLKVALGESTALMAGALLPLDGPVAATAFVFQLTQGL